jgi:hypothetical protein
MRSATLSFVLLLGVLGCGSSSDGGSNTGGVPPSTALKDVTKDDLIALCKANESKLNSLNTCTTVGLQESTQTACQASVSECEKSSATAQYSGVDCNGADTTGLTSCTVTVGEFADCLDELQSYLSSLGCKDAGKPITPPACFSSIQKQCASLFEG